MKPYALLLAAALVLAPLCAHAEATGAQFRQGMAHVQQGEFSQAIAVFRAILVHRPDLARVRLELARAFFLKGDDALALDHFERVLAGDLPPAVIANIRTYLARIRARRRWTAYVGAAIVPDTNAGAVSDADIIYIHDLPFRRDDFTGSESGFGLSVWGGGEYQQPLGDRFRLRAGADAAIRQYGGSKFDSGIAVVHLGPRWLIDRHTDASVLATGERRWWAGMHHMDALGGRLEVHRRLSASVIARSSYSWQRRDYEGRDWLDGPASKLLLGASWVVTPTVRLDFEFGYESERPDARSWRNRTRRVRLQVSVALPMGFTVGGGVGVHRTKYEGRWFPFVRGGWGRRDWTTELYASALNRSITFFGFSPQIIVASERRASTAQLYDYRRVRGELRFQRLF